VYNLVTHFILIAWDPHLAVADKKTAEKSAKEYCHALEITNQQRLGPSKLAKMTHLMSKQVTVDVLTPFSSHKDQGKDNGFINSPWVLRAVQPGQAVQQAGEVLSMSTSVS
jgi:hypothetical protein